MTPRLVKRMIPLSVPQLAWLDAEAARLGISLPELVRRIVDHARNPPRAAPDQTPDVA